MNTELSEKRESSSSRVIGGIIGIILILYFGYSLVYPVLGIFICGWVIRKISRPETEPMVMAISIQGFQLLGLVISPFYFDVSIGTIIEIIIFAGMLLWLTRRPGIVPAVLLIIYQVIAFAISTSVFSGVTFGDDFFKTTLVIFALRIGAIGFMIHGLNEIQKRDNMSGDLNKEVVAM